MNDPEAALKQTHAVIKSDTGDGREEINYVPIFFSAFKTDNPDRYHNV